MMKRLRVNVNTMEAVKTMEDVDTMVTNINIAIEEDAVHNTKGIGAEAVLVESTLILHITVGHTAYVPINENTAGPRKTDTIRTRCGATRFWELSKTAPYKSGRYPLVKLI